MAKKRSANQKYSKKAEGKLIDIMGDWILSPLDNDFGFDFDVHICGDFHNSVQEVKNLSFYIQLKSTIDNCPPHPFHDLDVNDIDLFVNQGIPVVLVKYYDKYDAFYWVIIQPYVWDILNKKDGKWREKSSKRIFLPNKLDDLKKLENEISITQNRIARHKIFSLDIGEGLNFEEISKQRERSLKEFKFSSLKIATEVIRQGDFEKGKNIFEEVLSAPGDDEFKLNAILNLTFQYNPFLKSNRVTIINLTNAGKELAEKLKAQNFVHLFNILEYQVLTAIIIDRLANVLYARKCDAKYGDNLFSVFFQADIISLNSDHQKIIKLINKSLSEFISKGNIQELISSLAIVIDTITYQIQKLSFIDRELMKNEEKTRSPLILEFEKLLESFNDNNDLKQFSYFKLGSYYYWSGNSVLGQKFVQKAVEISQKEGYFGHVESYKDILASIIDHPNPFDQSHNLKNPKDTTMEEYRDNMQIHLEFLGFDFSNPDKMTKENIIPALEDLKITPLLKFCENLRIAFLIPSPLGHSIALPSLGQKTIWCKYSGGFVGFSLENMFPAFQRERCTNCSYKSEREQNWSCTVKAYEDMTTESDFQKFIAHVRKSGV